jgi:DNA-damage-inducible protein J
MAKTATINVRIDKDLKEQAEALFKEVGLNVSQAITLFYKQVELQKGLPFPIKVPNKETIEALEEKTDNMKSFSSPDELFSRWES